MNRIYEISKKTIEKLKDKFVPDKLKALEDLLEKQFSEELLLDNLGKLNFNDEEIGIILNSAHCIMETEEQMTVREVKKALNTVSVVLPHLSGLARMIRINLDSRVKTAGVFPSGRMLVNPGWFNSLNRKHKAFIVAHEIFHLMLKTHKRSSSKDAQLFNLAHDYIINDMLVEAFNCPVPAKGLEMPGARHMSAEQLVAELKREGAKKSHLKQAGRDILPPELEEEWFPDETSSGSSTSKEKQKEPESGEGEKETSSEEKSTGTSTVKESRSIIQTHISKKDNSSDKQSSGASSSKEKQTEKGSGSPERKTVADKGGAVQEERIDEEVRRAMSIGVLKEKFENLFFKGSEPGHSEMLVNALKYSYKPPWEMALQRWMEGVSPALRSYGRPSRRGADRTDVVLVGKKREGWTIHIVLDTSGSMTGEFSRALGAISSFCTDVNVDRIHILQCDVDVTKDEYIPPEDLENFAISGLGGSDMSPAMRRLAEDSEVEAAIVLTDGCINYPPEAMPYNVLWVITHSYYHFSPGYGTVIQLSD